MQPTPRTRILKLIVAEVLGRFHTQLTKTKQKENGHKSETTVFTDTHTHTHPTKHRHFIDVPTFIGQLQLSEYIMWRFKNNEQETRTCAWLRLALYSSRQKYQERNTTTGISGARPTLSKGRVLTYTSL